MSTAQLNNFLNALEAVKQDFECVVCLELCKDPVTLSKCFHLICSAHFNDLKTCPKCGACLDGGTTFVDERYQSYVDSARELDRMFSSYRSKENLQSSVAESGKSSSRKLKKVTEIKEPKSKGSKPVRSDVNTSIMSTASTKVKGLEKRNNNGETPLHIACRLGKLDKVTELLTQGANTNTKDNAGWTPLHEAVQIGCLDLVKILLQHNSLVNVPGQSNETPLHEAVRYGHVEIAEELAKNGADVNARNVKGETPLQLAQGKIKEVLENAVENIVQTQSVNVTHISELHSEVYDDMKVYCVSGYRTVLNKLKALSKNHSNIHIEAKLTKNVTHLIVDADEGICQSSVEVLQGIVYGVWILSTDWITKSTEDKLENFQDYEISGVGIKTYNGPKNSRFNRYKQLPGIFNGCHFYLHNFLSKYQVSKTITLTKAILTKLITDAGGVVLRRAPNPELIPEEEKLVPYHARKNGQLTQCSHYIIFKDMYEPMYNMKHLKALPIGWLIECIEKYELCEPW